MIELVRSSESILVIWILVRSPVWPTTLEGLLVLFPFRFGDLERDELLDDLVDPLCWKRFYNIDKISAASAY